MQLPLSALPVLGLSLISSPNHGTFCGSIQEPCPSFPKVQASYSLSPDSRLCPLAYQLSLLIQAVGAEMFQKEN